MFNSKLLHKTKIYDNGLSPLLIFTSLFKIHFGRKTFIFDRFFSKKLQVLLRQIEIQMLNSKYFPFLPEVELLDKYHYQRSRFLHLSDSDQHTYLSVYLYMIHNTLTSII